MYIHMNYEFIILMESYILYRILYTISILLFYRLVSYFELVHLRAEKIY